MPMKITLCESVEVIPTYSEVVWFVTITYDKGEDLLVDDMLGMCYFDE